MPLLNFEWVLCVVYCIEFGIFWGLSPSMSAELFEAVLHQRSVVHQGRGYNAAMKSLTTWVDFIASSRFAVPGMAESIQCTTP